MVVKHGYQKTEVGVIPEDWGVSSLGTETEQLQSGVSVNSVDEELNDYNEDMLILKTSAVSNGKFLPSESKRIVPKDVHRAKLNPRADSLIISRMNTPDLVGECGYVDRDYPTLFLPDRLWMTQFRRESDICVKWLGYLLSTNEYKKKIKSAATGTSGSMKNISKESFLAIQIPYPSEEEQRDIATALSNVDALLVKCEALIAKKRNIKQAAMQQLLTGKLRLPGFSGNWKVKRLGEIADVDPENLGNDTNPDYSFNYISLEDVDRGTILGYSEQVFRTAPSRARRKVRKGDLLISTVRPNLKSHLIFRHEVRDVVCSTGFSVVRCKSAVADPVFVYFHLFAGQIEQQIEALISGSNYPAINSGDVKALQIPCPSLPEQRAIASILSDMDAEITALEARLEKIRSLKQGMMQELLTGRIRLV